MLGLGLLRPPGQDPAEAGGGAGAPGNVPEPVDELRDRVEHGLYGSGDRPAPHRRTLGPGVRPEPSVTVPLRAHQSVRQVRLRGGQGPRWWQASPAPTGPASGLALFFVRLLREG